MFFFLFILPQQIKRRLEGADGVPAETDISEDKEELPSMDDNLSDSHGPPDSKRKPPSLLVSLLGAAFTDSSQPAAQSKSVNVIAEEEMDIYCRSPSVPLSEDPLRWWQRHEGTFPLLSRLAKKILMHPRHKCVSRVFSTAGDVITAKRSVLKAEHVDQLVFLQKNMTIPKC